MSVRIAHKGTAWYVVVATRDPETGRRKERWLSGRDAGLGRAFTEGEARAWAQRHELAGAEELLGGYLAAWLERRRDALRPTTWRSYEGTLRLHVVPQLGTVRLDRLTPERLEDHYADMLRAGRSPKTVRYTHRVLHKALADAVRRRRLGANPATGVELPRVEPVRGQSWTRDELLRFLDEAEQDPLWPMWLLAATTGLRSGELVGLRWSDVDLQEAVLYVRRQVVWTGREVLEQAPKSENGIRTVPLVGEVVEVLRLHEPWPDPEARVFGDLRPWYPSYRFRKLCEKAGVRRIRLHDVRHTYATLALQSGVPTRVVSALLGHYDPGFTARQYQHVLDEMGREAADTFGRFLFGHEESPPAITARGLSPHGRRW